MSQKVHSLVVLSAIKIIYGLLLTVCLAFMVFVIVSINPTISFLTFSLIILILLFALGYSINGYYLLKLNDRARRWASFLDLFWFCALFLYFIFLVVGQIYNISYPAIIMIACLSIGIVLNVIFFIYFRDNNTIQLFQSKQNLGSSEHVPKRAIPLFLKVYFCVFVLGSSLYFFYIEYLKVKAFEYYIEKPVPQNVKISKVAYYGFLDQTTNLIVTAQDAQFLKWIKDYDRIEDCALGVRGSVKLKGSNQPIKDFYEELTQAQQFKCYQEYPDSLHSYVIWIPQSQRAYFHYSG